MTCFFLILWNILFLRRSCTEPIDIKLPVFCLPCKMGSCPCLGLMRLLISIKVHLRAVRNKIFIQKKLQTIRRCSYYGFCHSKFTIRRTRRVCLQSNCYTSWLHPLLFWSSAILRWSCCGFLLINIRDFNHSSQIEQRESSMLNIARSLIHYRTVCNINCNLSYD